MTAALALQKAMFQSLASSPELTVLIGPDRVFDDVPQGVKPPFLVFGETSVAPLGSASEEGEEHTIALYAWSQENGRKQATLVAGAVRKALQQLEEIEPPHVLAALHFVSGSIARDAPSQLYRARIELRAVTETAEL